MDPPKVSFEAPGVRSQTQRSVTATNSGLSRTPSDQLPEQARSSRVQFSDLSKRLLTKARRGATSFVFSDRMNSEKLDRYGLGPIAYEELPDEEVLAALAAEHEFRVRYTCKGLELCCFMLFGLVFFVAVALQIRAAHSFGVNNTIFSRLPLDPYSGGLLKEFPSMDSLVNWVNTSLVSNIWMDPGCGNGVCDYPMELPGGIYADRGCPEDCGDVRDASVQVLLSGEAAAAYLKSTATYPIQMCWTFGGASDCIEGTPQPVQLLFKDSILIQIDYFLNESPDATWHIIVPFGGQEAQVSLASREQTVLVFGGPNGYTHIPQIKTWWLWPSDGNRTVVLDGRALLDNVEAADACVSLGFNYTVQCQVPFAGTILPPADGCCVGLNNQTIALEGINPRKLYQQLLLTTPRVIGAADKQSNRVIAGLLFRQSRRAYSKKECGDFQHIYNKTGQFFYHAYGNRYGVVDPWCEHYPVDPRAPFGIDPVFLPSSSLYNANLSALDYYKPEEISSLTGLPYAFYERESKAAGKGFNVLLDINLSAQRAQDWFTYLVDGRFFHRQTDEVSIQLLTFNGVYRLFSVMDVQIQFTDAESLTIVPRVDSLTVPDYGTVAWIFQGLFFLGVIFLVISDVTRILNFIRRGRFLKAYRKPGRWVVTLSNLAFIASIGLWAALLVKIDNFMPKARFNVYNDLNAPARYTQLAADPSGADELMSTFDEVWSIVRVKKAYVTLTGVNMILLFIRALGLMHFHPRLGMVTRTLQAAFPDLVAFFVIWCIFMTVYAFMGMLVFGDNVRQLSTFWLALNQCFVMSLGDVSVNQALLDVATTIWDKIPSRIYFWSFNFLGTFIILQFLVAIVVDVLQVVRNEYARLEEQTLDWNVELNWLLGHWRHIRSVGVLRSLVLAYRAEQRAAQEGVESDHSWLDCGCWARGKKKADAAAKSNDNHGHSARGHDWRNNVLVVNGVEVPQAQVKRMLERLLLEKECRKGGVCDAELSRLTEYVVACFGDAPSPEDPEGGATNHTGVLTKDVATRDKDALALIDEFLTEIRGKLMSNQDARAKMLEGEGEGEEDE
ncbi:hypothetical protein KFL_000810290 [Klebsormidium nitens]|uniref:Polycystin cation channel PKD1/PKD2 domain-containing protein n=1 Tax=Klebsormidium nitens TaxID=105231 RepID=A0A1Y1I054_KLENI|nr:hypothetical protein KFL_000810290 [Klebsormidium nitens]|eukprot:GAQ81488.1 hypothetical protein KFL_000810290 [Klebsormidium nitens]